MLADVRDAAPVDERERVAQEAFVERLTLTVEMADAGIPRSELSVTASELHDLRGVFDLMPTEGEEAMAAIDARLAGVAEALAGYRVTLLESADRGRVSAKRQLREIAGQIRRWTGQEGAAGDLFKNLVASLDAEGALAGSLERHAAEASAAVAGFGTFLTDELGPRGRDREAVGREEYTLCSRYFLGAAVDLDETYAWAWTELKRLDDEMVATAALIAPGSTVGEAVVALDTDPARAVEGRERFRDWMQELADRTVAEMADVHFDIPEPLRRHRVPARPHQRRWHLLHRRRARTSAGPDGCGGRCPRASTPSRRGGRRPRSSTRASQATTSSVRRRSTAPTCSTAGSGRCCWVSGHGEGWALYAERLMDDLGYLADPGDKMGMLDGQAIPRRPGDRRHRHALRAGDPEGQPVRLPPR